MTQSRLVELQDALKAGATLPAELRIEISEALSVLFRFLSLEDIRFFQGRTRSASDAEQDDRVLLTAALMTKYGITRDLAARVSIPDGLSDAEASKALRNLFKAFEKWKARRSAPAVYFTDERPLEGAYSRLPASVKRRLETANAPAMSSAKKRTIRRQ